LFSNNLLFTSHAKPYTSLAEKRLGDSVQTLLADMETHVFKGISAVTNDGFGEIMTIRHMDLSPELPVNCFMVGIVTHHYNRLTSDFEVDPYDVDAIREGVKDLATAFARYPQ